MDPWPLLNTVLHTDDASEWTEYGGNKNLAQFKVGWKEEVLLNGCHAVNCWVGASQTVRSLYKAASGRQDAELILAWQMAKTLA